MIASFTRRFLLGMSLGGLVCAALATERVEDFKAKEVGGRLEINSPYGVKIFTSDFDLEHAHNYKIEIPLKDFRPPEGEQPKDKAADTTSPERALSSSEEEEEEEDDSKDESVAKEDEEEDDEENEDASPKKKKRKIVEVEDTTDDVGRLVYEANHFFNQGKFYEAMAHVDELTKRRPDFVRGWIMKGSLLYVQGEKNLAKEAWEKALEIEPGNVEIKNYLSRYR